MSLDEILGFPEEVSRSSQAVRCQGRYRAIQCRFLILYYTILYNIIFKEGSRIKHYRNPLHILQDMWICLVESKPFKQGMCLYMKVVGIYILYLHKCIYQHFMRQLHECHFLLSDWIKYLESKAQKRVMFTIPKYVWLLE